MRVGFVGAGRMGLPMVRQLVAGGHEVRAVGRSAEARVAIAEAGAQAVTSTADVASGARVVIICVLTDTHVREVCLDGQLLAVMAPGSTVVVHTTSSPRTIEAIAERAAPCGVQVVDAAVSGGPHDIVAGRLTVFAGGADHVVAEIQPILCCYADPVLHLGPVGTGQRVKLVNNALFAATIGLVGQAVALGNQLGVTEQQLLVALPHGSATSRVLDLVAGRGSIAEFQESVGAFVAKDIAVLRAFTTELGGDLGLLSDAIDAIGHAQ